MVIVGSLTGNMLPPFAVKLMFGGLIDPFGLECAATVSIRHTWSSMCRCNYEGMLLDENTLWSSKIQRAGKSQVGLAYPGLVN